MLHVFTSSAPNYLGKVRTLCRSLREFLPEARIAWLAADAPHAGLSAGLAQEPFDEILYPHTLRARPEPGWLFSHTLTELATALKPLAALEILARPECDRLLYFDPDIVLFSALDDLLAELDEASFLLTPHLLRPESDPEAVEDNELCSLRHGVFNLGFLGLRDVPEARALLRWWRDRCMAHCRGDWRDGSFTDQKWMNFAPVFFRGGRILASPRFNVAPWNIAQRELTGNFDDGFRVDGEPLGFYHFTGFDSGAHEAMIGKYAAGNGSVRMLVDWYGRRSRELEGAGAPPWQLGRYEDGSTIEPEHRRAYRASPELQREFPDPYRTSGGRSFRDRAGKPSR